MLSEDERREMKALARSSRMREDCRRVNAASRPDPSQRVDLDQLLNFLTTMSRVGPQPLAPRRVIPYRNARL